ncbi:histidine kinase [Saccharopolyspora indica]|uniref:sensor histidine kinase n=1 Tax=Saccharopolyspora indica TaxID=1229659 RepID=UPI0022EB1267|nr:histidine kinase [Saccharopolyspora indica]MDA3648955.1 histidine kinase [Saccharopolyspora indica]
MTRVPRVPLAPQQLLTGGVLLLLALFDLAVFNLNGPSGRVLALNALVIAVLAWQVDRLCRRERGGLAIGLSVLAALLSGITTYLVGEMVLQRTPGLVEALSLLLVVRTLCRRLRYWQLLPSLLPLLVALACLPRRLPDVTSWPLFDDLELWFVVLPIAFVLWGFRLRAEDAARLAAADRVRRAEQLELARDLHDDVAHYVTAMIVQAQAGELVEDPDKGRELFGNIERTGQDGLAAMSRMVRLLRESDAEPAPARAELPLEVIRGRVDQFAQTGIPVRLRLADGIDAGAWPSDVVKTVERLVQEGLTNIRKHARATTDVEVAIESSGGRLAVHVRNDGSRPGLGKFRPSGYGMIGLSERVSALGGELSSGPLENGGWLVSASIPIR